MTLLMIGAPEIIIILLIVLLLFGGKKIPELMKGLGKGVKSFKQGMNEMEEEVKRPLEEQSSQSASEESPTKDGDE
jgi:sec-independent protein translocase protein TatA